MELEDRLRSHLHDAEIRLAPSGAGADAAMNRARRRRRHLIAGRVVASLAIVAGLGGLALAQADEGSGSGVADGGPSATTGTTDLQWRETPGDIDLLSSVTSGDGTLYVLSTAPGRSTGGEPWTAPSTLYRSSDGETWEHVDLGTRVHELTERDGTLYALSTAPGRAASDPQAGIIHRSADGGNTWQEIALPDIEIPDDVDYVDWGLELAGGDAGVVAVVRPRVSRDVSDLVPAEYREDQAYYWQMSDTGLEVVDASVEPTEECEFDRSDVADSSSTTLPPGAVRPCMIPDVVVWSASWADLGVDHPHPLPDSHVYASSDGVTFAPVDVPWGAGALEEVLATAEGFVAVLGSTGEPGGIEGSELWYSADGSVWELATAPVEIGWVVESGSLGDRTILVTSGPSGTGLLETADGGRTWTSLTVPAMASGEWGPAAAAVGDGGIVIVTQRYDEASDLPASEVLWSATGGQWIDVSPEDLPLEHGLVNGSVITADRIVLEVFGRADTGEAAIRHLTADLPR